MKDWYDEMVEDLLEVGSPQFREKVYNGEYQEYWYEILHAEDNIKARPYFQEIFQSFLNAYV